jgi:hypothetical protein
MKDFNNTKNQSNGTHYIQSFSVLQYAGFNEDSFGTESNRWIRHLADPRDPSNKQAVQNTKMRLQGRIFSIYDNETNNE